MSASQDNSDDVIVVTPRRRVERLQDVPLSVSSISGESLSKTSALEITAIAQEVPNLTLEVSRGNRWPAVPLSTGGWKAPCPVSTVIRGGFIAREKFAFKAAE